MNVYLIGNGFDISHGLNSRYSDFKAWMIHEYEKIEGVSSVNENDINIPDVPSVHMGNHGEDYVFRSDAVKYLLGLLLNTEVLDDYWANFEESLAHLNVYDVISSYSSLIRDSSYDNDGDYNPNWEEEAYADYAKDILAGTLEINALFREWIDSVDITCARRVQNPSTILLPNNLFITFNYLETLEYLYNINHENIWYIHGERKKYGPLVIGHGEDFIDDVIPEYSEANRLLVDAMVKLRKPTHEIISNGEDYWSKIRSNTVHGIYSYGFGYGSMDEPYIRKLCQTIKESGSVPVWYLNSFDDRNGRNALFEGLIRAAGFDGFFSRFSTSFEQ